MCTNVISNGNKTIIGFNLDVLNMEYQARIEKDKVYIAIQDSQEGWPPLFGANSRGDFVAMPTYWLSDRKSNPVNADSPNIINLDIDPLLRGKTLDEIKAIVEHKMVSGVPGATFQPQLSSHSGNVLRIIPGQGMRYTSKLKYSVLTNFSPFKGDTERHPWIGLGRYYEIVELLESRSENLGVSDCFEVLRRTVQTICPTVISMVSDPTANTVYWCESKEWDKTEKREIAQQGNSIVIITMVILAEVNEVELIPCETGGMIKYIVRYLACGFLFASYVCSAQNLVL